MHPAQPSTAKTGTAMAGTTQIMPAIGTDMTGETDIEALTRPRIMATATTKTEAGIAAGTAETAMGTGPGPGVSHGIAAAGRAHAPLKSSGKKMNGT